MKFDKAYNREVFLQFLEVNFLPTDFKTETTNIDIQTETTYSKSVVKLGVCKSLDLVVYEIKHSGKNDPRVGLSKEAFRLLADEWQAKALIVFVPIDNFANYRFSLITIDVAQGEGAKTKNIYSNPRRYSYYLGEGVGTRTPDDYLFCKGVSVKSDKDLLDRFSVEVLTKAFYNELSDWYAWAVKIVRFPNKLDDDTDDDKYNTESVIRMITRLIFVWFLKQKKLVPNELFEEKYIADNLIDGFNPHKLVDLFDKSDESKYYKAILQNLFFAMLNSPITSEKGDTFERHFKTGRAGYDNNKLMRYKDMFKKPDLFVELANKYVPFLNGGLFDCLDDKDNGNYVDGFSDREVVQKALIIPDYLFFGEEAGKDIDLSEFYGDKKKKKVSARGVIDILKRYNFTVEENTPFDQEVSLDPELLGKVFENLLASFNPETKTTARKQTGSFYTPREIVQYMVDESIIAHLKRTVGEELEDEYRKLMRYTDEDINLSSEQKKAIMHSLHECKILDPACGSGAFPMGILQQMVHILSTLDPTNEEWKDILMNDAIDDTKLAYKNASNEERAEVVTDIERSFNDNLNRPDYARKLYLIERCIFGVDIQSIAVQISKLRFFISLVVDQKKSDDPKDNFGIRPLPNLEAKFVSANTLIGLTKSDASLFDSLDIKQKEDELKMAKHKIFGAKTSKTKIKYRTRVAELRIEIANLLEDLGIVGSETARQLQEWDMFDQNTSSPFFDPEWMFGVKVGFDIVIGNPPYIQLQANGGSLAEQLKNAKYEVFARTGDIYCLFYERGLQLLTDGGIETYITSNKWMRAGYGEKIRAYFTKNNPLTIIDLGAGVFDSATVDTNILVIQKGENKNQLEALVSNKKDFTNIPFASMNVNEGDIWTILSPIEASVKVKIEAVGTPLKDWDVDIYRGVLTGYNEAFIIDTAKRDELIAQDSKSTEIIKPILRGKDIKRYSANWAGLWLINTHNGVKVRGIEPIDINNYPAVKTHLDNYCNQLNKRLDKGITPYNLRNCAYLEEFEKEKIIWKALGLQPDFTYTNETVFNNDKANLLVSKEGGLKYLLAYLNSRIFLWQFSKIGVGMGDGFEFKVQYVKLISVPRISILNQQPFIELVDEILELKQANSSADTSALEAKIDQMVYKLYNLSHDEILVIDPNTPITKEEY